MKDDTDNVMGVMDGVYYNHKISKNDCMECFDTGCSHCTSPYQNRTSCQVIPSKPISIGGVSGDEGLRVHTSGVNADGKREFYTPGQANLALLSAQAYAEDGCILLFKDKGYVLKLNETEIQEVKDTMLNNYKTKHNLKVVRNVYYMDRENTEVTESEIHQCMNAQTRYFNTKVSVQNQDARILTLMLSGFSWDDLYRDIRHNITLGKPKDITIQGLNNFCNTYGKAPDLIRLAVPRSIPNREGLMTPVPVPTVNGEMIEIDVMEFLFNSDEEMKPGKRTPKLKTYGGAIAAAVCIDVKSGILMGKLIKTTANSKEYITHFLNEFAISDYTVKNLSCDAGVVNPGHFQVVTGDTLAWLQSIGIHVNQAEPYNHARGTANIEGGIRLIRALMRIAFVYIFRNPNLMVTSFTKIEIQKLQGEVFFWALSIINRKPVPSFPTISRYESFHGIKPNLQDYLVLPILCFVLIYRTTSEADSNIYGPHMAVGLYLGGVENCRGAIRAAIKVNGQVYVIITSRFTAASDGGGLNVYPMVDYGLKLTIAEKLKNKVQDCQLKEMEQLVNVESEEYEVDRQITTPIIETRGRLVQFEDEHMSESPPDVSRSNETDSPIVQVPTKNQLKKQRKKDRKDQLKAEENATDSYKKIYTPRVKSVSAPVKSVSAPVKSVSAPASPVIYNRKMFTGEISTDDDNKSFIEAEYEPEPISSDEKVKSTTPETPSDRVLRSHFSHFAGLADWKEIDHEQCMLSLAELAYIDINPNPNHETMEAAYHAARSQEDYPDYEVYAALNGRDLPKSFEAALLHPDWHEAATTEWLTVTESKCIVKANNVQAMKDKANGAVIVNLFPVYERKFKDGRWVNKVRLVADGRAQKSPGNTYASTPSREELLSLIQIAATLDWDYVHVDEKRAFLSAKYTPDQKAYAIVKGDPNWYEILGALYGLRSSPRDYQQKQIASMVEDQGFIRLGMCANIFFKVVNRQIVIVYTYVDDFFGLGSCKKETEEVVRILRTRIQTTEPIWNATKILGINLERKRDKNAILVSMTDKIGETYEKLWPKCEKFANNRSKKTVPIPMQNYCVADEDIDKLSDELKEPLSEDLINLYMALIGSFIWIAGIRFDIVFATVYLSWFTQNPRKIHLNSAVYLLQYLFYSKDVPLVLGGKEFLKLIGFTDASVGTGKYGRTVMGEILKLNYIGGAISAKSTATVNAPLSSFHSELESFVYMFKSMDRVINILTELMVIFDQTSEMWADNEAMIGFVKGECVAKGCRNMRLKMFNIREKYQTSGMKLGHMSGVLIPSDKMTKLQTTDEHLKFLFEVLGHGLIGTIIYGWNIVKK